MRFGFGLEKLGLFTLHWLKSSMVFLIIISALALYGVSILTFDGNPGRVFRANNKVSLATDRQIKAFPSTDETLILLIESKNPYNAEQLEAIRSLHLEVQFVEGVASVTSIFSARTAVDKQGNSPTILPNKLPPADQIQPLLKKLYKHPLTGDLLLSKDLTTSLIMISFRLDDDSFDKIDSTLLAVEQVTKMIPAKLGLKFTQTGVMAIRHDVLTSLSRDVHVLNLLGAILAVIICFVFFRNFFLVLIATVPSLIAVLWLLGMFGFVGRPVTALNNVLPTLVLVIAFCDALHMVQTIRRRLALGDMVRKAVQTAIKDVGPACAMTSLTTMVACASLNLSSSASVREFGTAGAASVFVAFLAVITLVPALSILFIKEGSIKTEPPKDWFNAGLDKFSDRIWSLVINNTSTIFYGSLIVLVVSSVAYFKTETNYDYRQYLSKTSPANHAIDKIDEKFGGADSVNILVEVKKPALVPPPALIKAHRMLEKMDGLRAVFSFATALDWLGQDSGNDEEKVRQTISKLPAGFKQKIMSPDKKSWLMTIYVPNQSATDMRKVLDKIDQGLQQIMKAHRDTTLTLSGPVARSVYSSPLVIGGLKYSLAAAVVITILMVGIFVRSMRYAIVSAIPNLLPLTLVAAVLFVAGSSFSLTTVLSLTIAFGIAIDNTIHIVNRLQIETETHNLKDALALTLKKTAPVLFAATLLLSAGMIVTRFSQLPSIRMFGLYMTSVLVLALFSAIMVLPALILKTAATKGNKQ